MALSRRWRHTSIGSARSPPGSVDLVDTGTLWLNLGDCYAACPPGRCADPMRLSGLAGAGSARVGRESVRSAGVDRSKVLPGKNLVGVPWRVAFGLQADGWIVRNAIVWHKPNAMPESVRDRMSSRYEMVFLLAKQRRYWFDLDAIRVPVAQPEAVDPGSVPSAEAQDVRPVLALRLGVADTARMAGAMLPPLSLIGGLGLECVRQDGDTTTRIRGARTPGMCGVCRPARCARRTSPRSRSISRCARSPQAVHLAELCSTRSVVRGPPAWPPVNLGDRSSVST